MPPKTKIQSVHLINLCTGDRTQEKVAAFKRLLDGKTFMKFQVVASPFGGNLAVTIQGEAETLKEFQGMVNMVLAEELMRRV